MEKQREKNFRQASSPAKAVVFLPTLNEEQGAPMVIKGLLEQGFREIVVVDGGSTDATVEQCKKLGALVMAQKGTGKGGAFKTFLSAYPLEDDSVVVMLDADATYSPQDAKKLVAAVNAGADVASGSRKMLVYNLKSLVHAIGGRVITLIASIIFLKWHPDFTTGYWAFRASALKKMQVTAQGFNLEANLFAETAKRNLSLAIVPVEYGKRVGYAKLSTFDAFKILFSLLKYRFLK